MAFDPDILRLRCPKCGGDMTVQCGPQDPSAGPQPVPCPFCQTVEECDVNARVLWTAAGHDDPPVA
jgi:hypothetical protein